MKPNFPFSSMDGGFYYFINIKNSLNVVYHSGSPLVLLNKHALLFCGTYFKILSVSLKKLTGYLNLDFIFLLNTLYMIWYIFSLQDYPFLKVFLHFILNLLKELIKMCLEDNTTQNTSPTHGTTFGQQIISLTIVKNPTRIYCIIGVKN